MKKCKKTDSSKLDHDDDELLSSFDNGEWKTVKNVKKEKLYASKTAAKTLCKEIFG